MKCDCCKKRKRFLESFADVKVNDNITLHFCVKCNDLFFKLRDAYDDNDKKTYNQIINKISKAEKKPTEEYLKWKEAFIRSLNERVN